MVEDVGGDGGQIDRDGAFADAALLIENDVHSHEKAFRMLPPRRRSTSDGSALTLPATLRDGAAAKRHVPCPQAHAGQHVTDVCHFTAVKWPRLARHTAVSVYCAIFISCAGARAPLMAIFADQCSPCLGIRAVRCPRRAQWAVPAGSPSDVRSRDHRVTCHGDRRVTAITGWLIVTVTPGLARDGVIR